MVWVAEVASSNNSAGMWPIAEGGMHPSISVAPIFGWMEVVLYRLAQPKNIEAFVLNLERPPKIMAIRGHMATLLGQPFRSKSS